MATPAAQSMTMEETPMKMRLESLSKRGITLAFGFFITVFFLSLIIGAAGPDVYIVQEFHTWACPPDYDGDVFDSSICTGRDVVEEPGVPWTVQIKGLDEFDRELLISIQIKNRHPEIGVGKTLTFDVTLSGKKDFDDLEWHPISRKGHGVHEREVRCQEKREYCDSLTLIHEPFLHYSYYRFTMAIEDVDLGPDPFVGDILVDFKYVNASFTKFELWFRLGFLILTLMALVAFVYSLWGFAWSDWTLEQKWVLVLLISLFFANNPFFALTVTTDGDFPIFFDNAVLVTFLNLLFFFWITLMDCLRTPPHERTFRAFYLPKICICFSMWIFSVSVYTIISLHRAADPSYNVATDLPGVRALLGIFFILYGTYLLTLLYIMVRAFKEVRKVQHLRLRFKFFFGLTCAVIFITAIGIMAGVVGPLKDNALSFLVYFSLFNSYIFTLAFMYSPADSPQDGADYEHFQMLDMNDDDDDDVEGGGDDFDFAPRQTHDAAAYDEPTFEAAPAQGGYDDAQGAPATIGGEDDGEIQQAPTEAQGPVAFETVAMQPPPSLI